MAYPQRKYVCISDVVLVETNYFDVIFCSFSFFWWNRETYFRWIRQESTGIYGINPENKSETESGQITVIYERAESIETLISKHFHIPL